MVSLTNQIEQYIKKMLENSQNGVAEFHRNDLAAIFMCVPSQINYVLETRFRSEGGYYVETRRGGAGYVKIVKLGVDEDNNIKNLLALSEDRGVPQIATERLLDRLFEEEFLSQREVKIVKAMLQSATAQMSNAEDADLLRAKMLNALLISLLREDI